jgi:hypothetical protein
MCARTASRADRLQLRLPLLGLAATCRLLLGSLVGAHAGLRDGFEEALNLGVAVREGEGPEVVARVLDQLDEGDEQAPGVRPIDYQPLQQHARYLLLHDLLQLQPRFAGQLSCQIRRYTSNNELYAMGESHHSPILHASVGSVGDESMGI